MGSRKTEVHSKQMPNEIAHLARMRPCTQTHIEMQTIIIFYFWNRNFDAHNMHIIFYGINGLEAHTHTRRAGTNDDILIFNIFCFFSLCLSHSLGHTQFNFNNSFIIFPSGILVYFFDHRPRFTGNKHCAALLTRTCCSFFAVVVDVNKQGNGSYQFEL